MGSSPPCNPQVLLWGDVLQNPGHHHHPAVDLLYPGVLHQLNTTKIAQLHTSNLPLLRPQTHQQENGDLGALKLLEP